ERHDDRRDDQPVRDRIAAEARRGAALRDGPEYQEHPAAEHVEGQDLAQRSRLHDQPEQPDADQCGAAQPEQRRRVHRPGSRAGSPATSTTTVAATVSVIVTSIARISGFAQPAGYARKPSAHAKPAKPTARNTSGPATSATRSRRASTVGASTRPARR